MTRLNHILRMNAASCLGFGALFLARPASVGAFLGDIPQEVLIAVGVGLVLNGVHLASASMRSLPRPVEIVWYSSGDLLWWTVSLGLVASGFWVTTASGVVGTLAVAAAAAVLGVVQLALLGFARSGLSPRDHLHRIGRSWLSLPNWIKSWLFALNAAFLAGPAFLPWDDAKVILIAYVASGPLLLGFALYDGGMTRRMGIGHLVPWVPLLGWLLYWLATSPDTGHAVGYVTLLAALITVCLAFDTYDIIRWARGERDLIAPLSASASARQAHWDVT